jgi:flagellar motility protein MotE (MotC chaperone)
MPGEIAFGRLLKGFAMPENQEEQVKVKVPAASIEKSKLPMLAAALGVLVFVIFVAAFSISMGVFSSSNVSPSAQLSAEAHDTTELAEQENELDEFDATYFDDFDSFDSTAPADTTTKMSAEDSLAQMAWYEKQKLEIATERRNLELAKSENEAIKYETMKLLEERKNLEDANLVQMSKLFDTMKAEEVAEILKNMTDTQVGLILMKMKKQNASKVLALVPPDRAARITLQMIDLASN